MGISTVPSFTPVDTATRLAALETADAKRLYMDYSRQVISGGGVLSVDTNYYVKWSQRFIMISAGRSAATAPNGYFQIEVPSVGTTITGVGGATNKTVTSAGIQLAAWDALYYILPLGSPAASIPANFRIVNYTSDFVVPDDWIPICTRVADASGGGSGPDTIQWCVGQSITPWIAPALTNCSNYGAGYDTIGYCKRNGIVFLKGLANGVGTGGAVYFTLPVGFRPIGGYKLIGLPQGVSPYIGRIDITPAGVVSGLAPTVAGTWLDFDNAQFPADQ